MKDCFRMIFCVIYTMMEVLRTSDLEDSKEEVKLREQFVGEIGQPIIDGELPAVILFQLVLNVASDKASPIPTKKTLLLLWKTVLVGPLTAFIIYAHFTLPHGCPFSPH